MGIENIGALMTRGVLIDVAALKGVETLPDTYEITVADLQQALARQQLTLQPGDAVIVHTGWGRLWGRENDRYMKTNPGLGAAAAEWIARQDPMLIGSDNAPINVTPSPDPQLSNPAHQIALVVNGVFLLENLRLDELAAQRAYEFALIVEPLKLVGGTGSTVAPIAIR
jgi:kynurenine formamidase